jgi:quercetin dioxygenase-like cupin family protein
MSSATRSRRLRATRSASLATVLLAVFVGTVFATGASGFHGTSLARGTTVGTFQFNVGDIKIQTKDRVDFAHATVTIDPLGHSGWHSHPGVVLVTVASGTVTFYDADCSFNAYSAGTSFVESGGATGLARNTSATVPAVVYVTYIVPQGAPALRIDQPDPGCPLS